MILKRFLMSREITQLARKYLKFMRKQKNGKITDLISYYETKKIKGEFVIVVNKQSDN